MKRPIVMILCMGLLLSACGELTTRREGARPTTPPVSTLPPPEVGPIRETPQTQQEREEMQQPAVLALLNRAEVSASSGNLDAAAANLERALRISPKDAELWHKLAQIRLRQERLEQAQDLAFKSNGYAKNTRLQAANWRLIQSARQLLGDVSGALKAQEKAQSLE